MEDNYMEKKQYIKPITDIIEIEQPILLAGSNVDWDGPMGARTLLLDEPAFPVDFEEEY